MQPLDSPVEPRTTPLGPKMEDPSHEACYSLLMISPPANIAEALDRLRSGESLAFDDLLPLVYGEMRGMAGRLMRREGNRHTLQATALVHEAYLKLQRLPDVDWQGRTHFFCIAGRTMRQVLVDHARTAKREKRGGGWLRQELDEDLAFAPSGATVLDLVALDEALDRLAVKDERKAHVVELRYFVGLTPDECASALDVSTRTVERDWAFAQAWLARELGAA